MSTVRLLFSAVCMISPTLNIAHLCDGLMLRVMANRQQVFSKHSSNGPGSCSDPVYGNTIIINAEGINLKPAIRLVGLDFEIYPSAMQRDLICQRNFVAFHAFAHAANSPSRFARLSFWCTGGVASRSLAIQSESPSGRKTTVSFARLRGDQDAAKFPARVIDRLGRTLA